MAQRYIEDTDTPREAAAGIILALRDSFREIAISTDSQIVVQAMSAAVEACNEAMRRTEVL